MFALLTISILSLGAVDASGQIAFVVAQTDEGPCLRLYDLEADEATVIGEATNAANLAWSPDGRHLAYETQLDGAQRIQVLDVAAGTTQTISTTFDWNGWPRWDPAGKRLAYSALDPKTQEHRVVVWDAATGTEEVWGGDTGRVLRPVWLGGLDLLKLLGSQDDYLWARSDQLIEDELKAGCLIGVQLSEAAAGPLTTQLILVTKTLTFAFPDWAMPTKGRYFEWNVEPGPKGKRMAFESNDGGDREIFVVSKDGVADMSNHRAADWKPVWALKGKWIAFESFRTGRRGIYRMYYKTPQTFAVAASQDFDCWAPSWAPDGKHIAYYSNQSGRPELHLADRTGKQHRQLTTSGVQGAPAWRPDVEE